MWYLESWTHSRFIMSLYLQNMNRSPNAKIFHFTCCVAELISVFLGIVLKKLIRYICI